MRAKHFLAGNGDCCAFTDTPIPMLWRCGDCCVFNYLADPTDVGFLDAFFPTAGSREASFYGAGMAS